MFTRESVLLKDANITKRTGIVKFASIEKAKEEEYSIDDATSAEKVLHKFEKSPDVKKQYVKKHVRRLNRGDKPKKVVTDFFEGLQDVKSSNEMHIITAKLFRQNGIFKTADKKVYQDLATGDFWKIDGTKVVRMFKETDGISDRISDRHSVMQKAAAAKVDAVWKKGDKVEFVKVNEVSQDDWGVDEKEYETLLQHEGQTATIEAVAVLNNNTNPKENYYDISFADGFEVAACSAYHLEPTAF